MSNRERLVGMLRGDGPPPENGIFSLVEMLLSICDNESVRLKWRGDHVTLANPDGTDERVPVALRNSALRAVIARIATLITERGPVAVSPFGGEGTLSASDS